MTTMSMSCVTVITALLLLLTKVDVIKCYYVEVQLFSGGNCGGNSRHDALDWTCYSYPSFGHDISGVFMPVGSCVILHKELACRGETYMVKYPEYDLCTLPCCGWNDRVLSVQDCDTREVEIQCPNGTYIREIEHAAANQGMTVHCYKPTEDEPTLSRNTHGLSLNNPSKTTCPVASHGLSANFDVDWGMFVEPRLECSRAEGSQLHVPDRKSISGKHMKTFLTMKNNDDHANGTRRSRTADRKYNITELCDARSALTGIKVLIDEADVIKELYYVCNNVPDPTAMCEPLESLGTVVECDNTGSGNEIHCGYSQTVGVGQSRTLTETERKEMTFSAEWGFTIEAGITGLSASMSTKLGYSELVGYEWSQSDGTTWTQETTVSATILVRPYTHSKLEQLIGKCSFYGISVNFFRQTDVNSTGVTTTYFKV